MNQTTKKLSIANIILGYFSIGLIIVSIIISAIERHKLIEFDRAVVLPTVGSIIALICMCFFLVNAVLGIPLSIAEKKEKSITKQLTPKAISMITLVLSIVALVSILFYLSAFIAFIILEGQDISPVIPIMASVFVVIGILCSITITIFSTIVVAKIKKIKK